MLIIDAGFTEYEQLAAHVSKHGIIIIEGDRHEQQLKIQSLFPKASYVHLISGEKNHPEGIFDAMGNIYKGMAKAVRGQDYHAAEFPGMEDGVRGMYFIEQAVASHKQGNVWIDLNA